MLQKWSPSNSCSNSSSACTLWCGAMKRSRTGIPIASASNAATVLVEKLSSEPLRIVTVCRGSDRHAGIDDFPEWANRPPTTASAAAAATAAANIVNLLTARQVDGCDNDKSRVRELERVSCGLQIRNALDRGVNAVKLCDLGPDVERSSPFDPPPVCQENLKFSTVFYVRNHHNLRIVPQSQYCETLKEPVRRRCEKTRPEEGERLPKRPTDALSAWVKLL